jgi:hypothetical protein
MNPQRIKDLNIKPETLKIPEENKKKTLFFFWRKTLEEDTGIDNYFLYTTLIAQEI